jgi:hypothetical protein
MRTVFNIAQVAIILGLAASGARAGEKSTKAPPGAERVSKAEALRACHDQLAALQAQLQKLRANLHSQEAIKKATESLSRFTLNLAERPEPARVTVELVTFLGFPVALRCDLNRPAAEQLAKGLLAIQADPLTRAALAAAAAYITIGPNGCSFYRLLVLPIGVWIPK